MTVGWCGAVISILLLINSPEPAAAKKKIIKLIVPHKIKFLHHTHVLLVTPKKKSSHKVIKEELADDDSNYHHYIHDSRPKGKPQVHYVLPYIAQSKESQKNYKQFRPPLRENDEDFNSYSMDDYHSRPEESDVVVKVLPPGKSSTVHRGLRVPYEAESAMSSVKLHNKPRYVFKESMRKPHYTFENPGTEEMLMPSMAYHTLPEDFESDYMSPVSGMDPNGLTPEEGGWGSPTYSMPEKNTPIRNFYKSSYFEPSRSGRYKSV